MDSFGMQACRMLTRGDRRRVRAVSYFLVPPPPSLLKTRGECVYKAFTAAVNLPRKVMLFNKE